MTSLKKLAQFDIQLENFLEEIEAEIPQMTAEDKEKLERLFSEIEALIDPYDNEL